jgi:hypothetical protein
MPHFEILYDSLHELHWFRQLDPRLRDLPAKELTSRDRSSERLETALSYDRPDIVLVADGIPILVIEQSEEVPSGHNVGQRFARLAASARAGAVTVKVFPFVAMKHGGVTSGPRFVNLRLIEAMRSLENIYGVPVLAVNWLVDQNFEILKGPEKDAQISRIISVLLDTFLLTGSTESFASEDVVTEAHAAVRRFSENIKRRADYDAPPPSVQFMPTAAVAKLFGIAREDCPKLTDSLVYRIGMKGIRSDPYTGSAILYDYLYCRGAFDGVNRAMILHFPAISIVAWRVQARESSKGKSVRLFVEVADVIVFADGYLAKEKLFT